MTATRKSRFSLSAKIASILACVAILSVGFASWWIVNLPETQKVESGSFTVYTVEEKNITISTATLNPASIIFGYDATGTTKWLGHSDDVAAESLSATLTFTVAVDDTGAKLSDFLDSVTIDLTTSEAYNNLVTSGYVANPVITCAQGTVSGNNVTIDDADTLGVASLDVTATITFDWGTVTNGENPYVFFNDEDSKDSSGIGTGSHEDGTMTYAELASEMLNKISGLGTEKYTIEVKANGKS